MEIYNKPDFQYREETFAILAVNAWELFLKAKLLHDNGNELRCLYVYERRQGKAGRPTKKIYRRKTRSGNYQTRSLGQVITALEKGGVIIPRAVRQNIGALVEVRDNAVHYVCAGPLLAKQVMEVGSASIQNYVRLSNQWFGTRLSKHNLCLMPLGFVSAPAEADAVVMSSDEKSLVQYLAALIRSSGEQTAGEPYHVALTVHLNMKRSTGDVGSRVVVTDDPSAMPVTLADEDVRKAYPWDYGQLTQHLQARYSDFKVADRYHRARRALMSDARFCKTRYLDPGNPRSGKKDFYSPNIVPEFDKHYARRADGR
jgi:hypothetical protein